MATSPTKTSTSSTFTTPPRLTSTTTPASTTPKSHRTDNSGGGATSPSSLILVDEEVDILQDDECLGNHSVGEFWNQHCTYLPAMLGWFLFSALLSSYNKYVFGQGHMNFPCPLLLTSIHFSIQWIFSFVACEIFPESLGTDRLKSMSWSEWFMTSFPCGLVTALDVGLSNLSMVYITLTFYTMVKSSTPVFVLGWAYLFGIERITWSLIGVICIIAVGEFLTVFGETEFVPHGFALCLSASVLSGARWTLVQKNLQAMDPPLKSTITTMRLLAPSMFASMLVTSIVIERPWTTLRNQQNSEDLLRVLMLGLIGGTVAIFMILCEFYLILHATAIILMIGGVIKELTTIVIGVSFFGDQLNAINVTGVCIVFSGVLMYKVVFHLEKDTHVVEAVPLDEMDDPQQELVIRTLENNEVLFKDEPTHSSPRNNKRKSTRNGEQVKLISPSLQDGENEVVDDTPGLHMRSPRYHDTSANGGEKSNDHEMGII